MNTRLENYILSPLPMKKELLTYFSEAMPLTIFDIGGCEGEDSIRYAKLFPNARIFTVEALPSNVEKIKSNLKRFDIENVKVLPIALSDQQGIAHFYVSSGHPPDQPIEPDYDHGNKSSSLLEPAEHLKYYKWLQFDQTIDVSTNTLEKLAKDESVDEIDFVHMDVQGAELKVLKGAGDFIKRMKAIWLEVATLEFYQGQPLKADIQDWLEHNGFAKTLETGKRYGDQFYVNTRYFKKPSLMKRLSLSFDSARRLARNIFKTDAHSFATMRNGYPRE